VGGKTVKALTVLGAVAGSNGVTHSFSNTRKLIYRATFTDASTGIATTTIP
jgi:hypothetical protein